MDRPGARRGRCRRSEAWPRLTPSRAPSTGSPRRAASRITCAPRSRHGSSRRRPARTPTSAATACSTSAAGSQAVSPVLRAVRGRVRRRGHRQPGGRPRRLGGGATGRGRLVRPRALHAGARARRRSRRRPCESSTASRRPAGACSLRRTASRSTTPRPTDYWRWTHAGLERLFRESADVALRYRDARRRRGDLPRRCPPCTSTSLFRKAHCTPLCRTPRSGRSTARRRSLDRAVPSLREPIPGSLFTQLPRGGGQAEMRRSRHRRRGLHRLEPRAGAARARRRRARARQLLDRAAATNLAGLDVELVEGELRSYERVHAAVRGCRARLPPRRARLGAALRAGSADDERRQRRGHAERPARGPRRGRTAGRLRVVLVGLRQRARPAADRVDAARTRSRRTASPSSPPSATA